MIVEAYKIELNLKVAFFFYKLWVRTFIIVLYGLINNK